MCAMKPVTVALLGAGARGELNLATLAHRHPDLLRFTALAEPHDARREQFIKKFDIPRQNAFRDWRELLAKPRLADTIVNALPCRMHYESTRTALLAGYHNFLEKPMALKPSESVYLTRLAEKQGLILMVALQSRYNKIYSRVRQLFDENQIGRLMNIDCAENIGYWHFIMSYVRGIHHRTDMSHSFVIAKGVHDLDLVSWYAGAPAAKIASFGSLQFFNSDNAPQGAPERCMDGCPVFDSCEFNAYKQFVKPGQPDIPYSLFAGMSPGALIDYATNPRFRTLAAVIEHDISRENVLKNLATTMNGRCVFRCDNNVVDHQTVSIEFANGVTASFALNAFSLIWERSLNLHGTKGEIRSTDFSGRLNLRTYNPARNVNERIRYHGIIHGGGDEMILIKFAEAVRARTPTAEILTGADKALESHLICFAAEQARLTGMVVDMKKFRKQAEKEAAALE